MILMHDKLDEIHERMKKLSEEEKLELARLAGEAYGRRRAHQGTEES